MLNNELEDLGIDPTNVDAELDALSEMDITGCGLGRRAAALLADEDMTDEERAEAIRELTQQAPKEEPDDGLPDDPLEIEPIGLTPETCEATKADIPETPPLMEADLTDETPDDRANQVLAYIIDWPLSTPDQPDPGRHRSGTQKPLAHSTPAPKLLAGTAPWDTNTSSLPHPHGTTDHTTADAADGPRPRRRGPIVRLILPRHPLRRPGPDTAVDGDRPPDRSLA